MEAFRCSSNCQILKVYSPDILFLPKVILTHARKKPTQSMYFTENKGALYDNLNAQDQALHLSFILHFME